MNNLKPIYEILKSIEYDFPYNVNVICSLSLYEGMLIIIERYINEKCLSFQYSITEEVINSLRYDEVVIDNIVKSAKRYFSYELNEDDEDETM